MVVLIEYLWNQRNRYEGIEEYHRLFADVCDARGVSLLGLFKPLNEPWQWAHLFEADSMDEWQSVIDEVDKIHFKKREQIVQNNLRVYSRREYNPRPKNLNNMRFVNVELDVWEGVNVGIKEYHDAHVDMFKGLKGVWYMGQYSPANEPFNWAHLYWYDTHQSWREAIDICYRSMGRPERIKTLIGRTYEIYNP
jgi:hypothetical protein